MRNTYLDYCIEHNYTAQDYMAFEDIIKNSYSYKLYELKCSIADLNKSINTEIKRFFHVLG